MKRRDSRLVMVGDVPVGKGHPISIQSMTNTRTEDVEKTLAQIKELEDAGCEIIRVAIPNEKAAKSLPAIIAEAKIPVVADIHFDYRLAIMSAQAGVQALRINPGNIGGQEKVKAVVKICHEKKIPIRIGVNSGSLEKDLELAENNLFSAEDLADFALTQYSEQEVTTAKKMVISAAKHIEFLQQENFSDIIVSLKSSNVSETLLANRLFAARFSYPLHIGITEAGSGQRGKIKSAVGLGALLSQGLGDTLRVSLTGNPVQEVKTAYQILASLNLRCSLENFTIISCPTCGRTEIELENIARKVEKALSSRDKQNKTKPLTVAVMGCAVNGPGEAARADIGIAGGKKSGVIFRQGEIIKKVPEDQLVSALLAEINKMECE